MLAVASLAWGLDCFDQQIFNLAASFQVAEEGYEHQTAMPAHPSPESVTPLRLREALGRFATGVTIVTARDAHGQPVGLTANSFNSVSLDPPLLLVSIAKTSSNYATFAAAKGFAVNNAKG